MRRVEGPRDGASKAAWPQPKPTERPMLQLTPRLNLRPKAAALRLGGFIVCLALAGLTGVASLQPASAREAAPATADPVLEARVMQIASELRCLVCQNETIAASHADLAIDLRNQVREMLRQGKTDRDIYDYMTARYGDFVLYRPPLKGATALLWFGPALLLGGGLLGLWWMLRRRSLLAADQFEADEMDSAAASPPHQDPAR